MLAAADASIKSNGVQQRVRQEDPVLTVVCVCVVRLCLLAQEPIKVRVEAAITRAPAASSKKQPRPWQPILILSEQANKWRRDAGLVKTSLSHF